MHLGSGPPGAAGRRSDHLRAARQRRLTAPALNISVAGGLSWGAVAGAKDINVLVVDDQEVIRDTLQVALDDEGFTVECASNGREALELMERWKPDVILLDLMMPIMDGWQFCAEQKRTGDETPIVLLSADGGLPEHAEELCAAAFIAKPFDIDRVFSTIERVC